ncbi:unnamed protein product [Moneuplotes crassus]|uniref:Uncharacterized protein n=1 Tax=Euplotes crassus TaxID=5936 RepID=A0AAD1U1Q2_EUPCR|nr:unnamed protein product [Moneuplotes crassus]
MEIFIKAEDKTHKINWLSSIPDKYKEDILKKVKQQAIMNDSKNRGRKNSQDFYQMAKEFDQEPGDNKEITFEVILNIKGNMAPKKKKRQKSKLSGRQSRDPQKNVFDEQSLLSTIKVDNLPNLLKTRTEAESVLKNFTKVPTTNLEEISAGEIESESEEPLQPQKRSRLGRHRSQPSLSISNQSYCVQYMGVNDDKLEVLTRRVLLDPKAMRRFDHQRIQRPARLEPLPKKPKKIIKKVEETLIAPEPEQEPEIKTESEDQPPVELEDSVESDAPIGLVTRPQDEFEDFNIPLENCAPEVAQKPTEETKKDIKKKEKGKKKKSKKKKPKKLPSKPIVIAHKVKESQNEKSKEKHQVQKPKLVSKPPKASEPEPLKADDRIFENRPSLVLKPAPLPQLSTSSPIEGDMDSTEFGKGDDSTRKPLNITFDNSDPMLKEEEKNYLSSQNLSQHTLGADLSSVKETPDEFDRNISESDDCCMPRPDKWDQYVIHSGCRPKGLHAIKKQVKLSESEQTFGERYSKRNIGIVALEKSGISICSQIRKGFKGFRAKQHAKTNMSKLKGIKTGINEYDPVLDTQYLTGYRK